MHLRKWAVVKSVLSNEIRPVVPMPLQISRPLLVSNTFVIQRFPYKKSFSSTEGRQPRREKCTRVTTVCKDRMCFGDKTEHTDQSRCEKCAERMCGREEETRSATDQKHRCKFGVLMNRSEHLL